MLPDVIEQQVSEVHAEAVPDHDPHHGGVGQVGWQGVCGYLPAALAEPFGQVEYRISGSVIAQLEREYRKIPAFGEQLERAHGRDFAGQVERYVLARLLHMPVALEAEPDEVVVLG